MLIFWLVVTLQATVVVCESDPLLIQLLQRVNVLENEGIQQKQRILELEVEVSQLKQILYDEDLDQAPGAEMQQTIQDVDETTGDDSIHGDTDSSVDEQGSDGELIAPSRIYKKGTSDKVARRRREAGIGEFTCSSGRRFVLDTELVAFHATLDGGLYDHNHISQVLLFDDVKTNIGDAYNNKTGIFVTPRAGIYIFSVSVMSTGSQVMHGAMVDLMKNGNEIGAAFAEGVNFMDQGSITVVTELAIGDEVHVAIQRRDDSEIWGDKLTSFMGCLITPL